MGVKGLWVLLEPAGFPISLDNLEGKVIAVDISIWINQSIKGIRDKRGILAENAHLLGLFNRICKLLFHKIKPVFVFDGGVPALKRQTIEERRLRRDNILSKVKTNVNKALRSYISDKLNKEIEFDDEDEDGLNDAILGLKEWNAKDYGSLFVLPEDSPKRKAKKEDPEGDWQEFNFGAHPRLRQIQDTALIDTESDDFKSLPPEIRHELLAEMREKKKRLNKVEDIPTATGDFSDYQMKRILVRRKIQEKMEEVQGEMISSLSSKAADQFGGNSSEGYTGVTASRVMSDDSTHFIYMNKRRAENGVEPGPAKLLMPKRKRDDSEREFIPKRAYRDIFVTVEDYDFGVKEEAEKEGASTLRDKLRKEMPSGPTLKFDLGSPHFKLGKVNSKVQSESDSDDDDDFVAVEEIDLSDSGPSDAEKAIKKKVDQSVEPLTPKHFELKKVTIDHPEESSSTIITDQSPQSIIESPSSTRSSQRLPVINFDEPVASTSKEADRIESQMANLSTRSPTPSKTIDSSTSNLTQNRIGILADLAQRQEKLAENDIESLYSFGSDDSDLFIESEEIRTPVKGAKPSVEILSPEPVIKSHHFSELDVTSDLTSPGVIQTPPSTSKEGKEPPSAELAHTPVEQSPSQVSPDKSTIKLSTPKTPSTPLIKSASATPNKQTPSKQTPSKMSQAIKVIKAVDRDDYDLNEQIKDMKKAERQTSTVAQNMISDCRELLSMFGIPYVMSPMEAEAQCAALETQGLTDGTITDDSDVWLFGGKTVYKNFFNQSKFVEKYVISDIEQKLKLNRDTMICIAMLTGCDYTDGVEGVGPVKAVEILSEFPGSGMERLRAFKDWWTEKRKGKDKSPGNKLRSQLLKLNLSDNFPSDLVYKAFMSPIVLDSKEPFSWGMPDLDLLRRYAAEKMRWSKEKIDNTLIPIIKKLNEKQSQLRMDQFISRGNNNRMGYASKRLANAVNKMSGSSEPTVEVSPVKPRMSKLREQVKNQRKKGRTTGVQRNQTHSKQPKPKVSSSKAAKKPKRKNGEEPETIKLSESSSDEE